MCGIITFNATMCVVKWLVQNEFENYATAYFLPMVAYQEKFDAEIFDKVSTQNINYYHSVYALPRINTLCRKRLKKIKHILNIFLIYSNFI